MNNPTTQPRTEVFTDEYNSYDVTFTETLNDTGRIISVEPVLGFTESGFRFNISHDNAIGGPTSYLEDLEAYDKILLVHGWLIRDVLDIPDADCSCT